MVPENLEVNEMKCLNLTFMSMKLALTRLSGGLYVAVEWNLIILFFYFFKQQHGALLGFTLFSAVFCSQSCCLCSCSLKFPWRNEIPLHISTPISFLLIFVGIWNSIILSVFR